MMSLKQLEGFFEKNWKEFGWNEAFKAIWFPVLPLTAEFTHGRGAVAVKVNFEDGVLGSRAEIPLSVRAIVVPCGIDACVSRRTL